MPRARIAAAALAALLGGCIPYALEPGFRGSRSDLGDAVPAFIAAGRTTRSEVLQRLGPPEVEALDSRWFYYESDYLIQSSGVVIFIGGPGGAARFDRALWKEGEGLPSMWANLRDDPLNCAWARKGFGTVLVLEDAILFVPPEAAAHGTPPAAVRIERTALAKVAAFGPSPVNVYETAGVQMTRRDGRLASFTLCGARARPATDQLAKVLSLLTSTPR